MTGYAPVGHLTGTFSSRVSITDRNPWIYTIASMSARVICIRESNSDMGLLGELAIQLGTSSGSFMLAQATSLGLALPGPPYVVVAARLPSGNDPAEFDGTSATIRAQCVSTLQAKIATRFIPSQPGWTDFSVTQTLPSDADTEIDAACEAIYLHTQAAITGMVALARSIPFHIVLLDAYPVAAHESDTMEAALSEIEVAVHRWLIGTLKATFGAGGWWSQGIPESIRVNCTTRREQDGGDHTIAADAYMMLIDLVAISKHNWSLASAFMERVSGRQGKEAGTAWIGELNQIRKLFAHPIRGSYVSVPSGSRERILDLRRRVLQACTEFPIRAGDNVEQQGGALSHVPSRRNS